MMLRTFALLLFSALALALTADTVAAAANSTPATTTTALVATDAQPLMASYADGFVKYWGGVFKKQNGVVMIALVVGALCLFIITRGKWRK